MINHGVRLSVAPDALERWQSEQRELERQRTEYQQREEAREAEILRARQRAAEPFTELQVDVLGAVIAQERHRERQERKVELDKVRAEFAQALAGYGARGDECVRQLRAELAVAKGVGAGTVIDLAAEPVIRKTRDNAA